MAAQSSSSRAPLKGILKKPSSTTTNSNPPHFQQQIPVYQQIEEQAPSSSPTNPTAAAGLDNLTSALAHDASFTAIATLTQLPQDRTSPYDASRPSARDATTFRHLAAQLTEREYGEDLVEERNCEGLCGYTLCGRPRRRHVGEFRIRGGAFAPTGLLNRWCSDECARRALWVGLQVGRNLVRGADGEPVIELWGEEQAQGQGDKRRRSGEEEEGRREQDGKMEEEGQQQKQQQEEEEEEEETPAVEAIRNRWGKALALERGGGTTPSGSKAGGQQMMTLVIREKEVKKPPVAPDVNQPLHEDSTDYLVLEGHRTAFGARTKEGQGDEEDEELGDIII